MEPIWQAEITLLEQLQQVPLWLIQFFKGVTFLGEESFYMVLMPIFYWSINMRIGYRFTLILLLSNWINGIFKMFLHLPRPYWLSGNIEAHVAETSFGLPSGHSTNAASLWLFLASTYRRHKLLAVIFILLTLLIMISRLILGVHFFSDVLAGFLLGLILLIIFLSLDNKWAGKISALSTTNKIGLCIASTFAFLIIGLLPILVNTFTLPTEWITRSVIATQGVEPAPFSPKSIITLAGVWLGMNIGYTLLQSTSHPMNTKGSIKQHTLRLAIGLIVAMIIRIGLSAAFNFASGSLLYIFDFIRYAFLAFWISYLAPMLFLKTNLYEKSV